MSAVPRRPDRLPAADRPVPHRPDRPPALNGTPVTNGNPRTSATPALADTSAAGAPVATFRFDPALEDLLPPARRGVPIEHSFLATPAVKDAIEALGVPHPEVGAILVNGHPAGFDYRLRDGDDVRVFGPVAIAAMSGAGHVAPAGAPAEGQPAPAATPGQGPVSLMRAVPEPPRFVLDGHLGRLARYLRMLGFDAAYRNDADDAELARCSAAEERILLTRDRGLLRRSVVRLGYLLRNDDPRAQLAEVERRYGLAERANPFTRCIRCNGLIEPAERAAVADRLQPKTLRYYDTFGRCRSCGTVYWPGSHYERMRRVIDELAGVERTEPGS